MPEELTNQQRQDRIERNEWLLRDTHYQRIVDKWAPLLESLPENQSYIKSMTSLMMENQSSWFESMKKSTSLAPFFKFVFPLVRENLYLQPMSGPIGGIVFYRPRYYNTLVDPFVAHSYEQTAFQPELASGALVDDKFTESPSTSTRSLLAPDCPPCGGEKGNHKLGCPVVRKTSNG